MQQSDNSTNIQKKRLHLKGIVFLTFICLLCLILAQTFIKIPQNYNTLLKKSTGLSDNSFGIKKTAAHETLADNENVYVKIGGIPIGISINAGGLIVIGESEVSAADGSVFPARGSGIEVGDVIVGIDKEQIYSVYQLKKLLDSKKGGSAVSIDYIRDGKQFETSITPAKDKFTDSYRLGLVLKEDVGGVGTLTFVTQEGNFAALGHYIEDAESGLRYELGFGNIYNTEIEGIIKGERGRAGGLIGEVNRLSPPIGDIRRNTEIGIYGRYIGDYKSELFRIASKGEAKPGAAKVYTTIEGSEPKFYDIEIVKVVSQSEAGEKGMVIAVKDKELLSKTGGIVQGMSGSPIIQNGILIGAVTHVFVQDPTRGYAVHSRFMFDYASSIRSASGTHAEPDREAA